jgi:hypothetical protein
MRSFNIFYCSLSVIQSDQSGRKGWAGYLAPMGGQDFGVGPEGKGPQGRPRNRSEDNIKINP